MRMGALHQQDGFARGALHNALARAGFHVAAHQSGGNEDKQPKPCTPMTRDADG